MTGTDDDEGTTSPQARGSGAGAGATHERGNTMLSGLRTTITEERLAGYRRRMKESHATPLVCVGVGHAPGPAEGQFVLCITEDQDAGQVLHILRGLVRDLEHALGAAANS